MRQNVLNLATLVLSTTGKGCRNIVKRHYIGGGKSFSSDGKALPSKAYKL